MDDARFKRISQDGLGAIALVMSDALGDDRITYNAYLGDLEVVVLGHRYPLPEGGTRARPVAILISPEVFRELRVDEESARWNEEGEETPPLLK